MDFLKVVDLVDFDLERVLSEFRNFQVLESSSEFKVKCGLTKLKFLRRVDGAIHPDIRIFEEGRLFLLREPLTKKSEDSRAAAPKQRLSQPQRMQSSHQKPKRRKTAHLVPGPAGGAAPRYWSGATGSTAVPQPFSAWGPSQPAYPPPKRAPRSSCRPSRRRCR